MSKKEIISKELLLNRKLIRVFFKTSSFSRFQAYLCFLLNKIIYFYRYNAVDSKTYFTIYVLFYNLFISNTYLVTRMFKPSRSTSCASDYLSPFHV